MRKGRLFVISGPSGVGKGTVIARVLEDMPNVWKSVSATTRKPREGEVDGREYFFFSRDRFEEGIKAGSFLEWAEYSGNMYGTPADSVKTKLDAGEDVILEIEVQGALQVKDAMPDAVLVFIEPPSMEELEARLRGRGTEDEETIQKRMETARVEQGYKNEYNSVFVNDDLDTTVSQLERFIANPAK